MRLTRGIALCAVPLFGGFLLAASAPSPNDGARAANAGAAPSHLIGRDIATYALIQSIAGPSLGAGMMPGTTLQRRAPQVTQ